MKTYLVLSADKTEFKEACKTFKAKLDDLSHYVKSNGIFAFKSKKEAIKLCRKQNHFKAETEIDLLLTYDKIYYLKEISLY